MTKFERRRYLVAAIVVLSLVLTSLCSFAYAKFVTNETIDGQVTVSANLGTIVLQEHEVERNQDGSYELTGEIAETGNQYTLIPGLDVPKDPHVVITKENDIPVYVYVEVVDELGTNSGITYSIAEGWTELSGVSGKVYYREVTEKGTATFDILTNNTVYVSQNLNQGASDLELTFHATMKQAVDGKTAEDIYKDTTNY